MLFHIFDGYTEVVHEVLGLIFVVFTILHVILNWKSLSKHFKKRMFLISFVVTMLLSTLFIYIGMGHDYEDRIIIEKLTKAPISQTFDILDIDYNEAKLLLKKNKITVGNSKTIEEISLKNQKSQKDILELILNK